MGYISFFSLSREIKPEACQKIRALSHVFFIRKRVWINGQMGFYGIGSSGKTTKEDRETKKKKKDLFSSGFLFFFWNLKKPNGN